MDWVAPDRRIDPAFVLGDAAVGDADVELHDSSVGELPDQRLGGRRRLRYDHHSARLGVEPVDDPRAKRVIDDGQPACYEEPLDESGGGSCAGMDDQPRGLVDDNDSVIFMEDRERSGSGLQCGAVFGRPDDPFSATKPKSGLRCGVTIDGDQPAPDRALNIATGTAWLRLGEVLVEALSFV